MTWGAVAGAAVGVVGSYMSSKDGGGSSGGGAGTQTATKEPWAAAQPWIMNNLQTGQNLQNRYTAQPFSDMQNQAYQNQGNQSAYMRAAVPSLLAQLTGPGTQLGYDRNNPNAKPTPFDFNGLVSASNAGNEAVSAAQGQRQGLLAMLNSAPSSTPLNLNPAPAAPKEPGSFVQQDDLKWDPWNENSLIGLKDRMSGGYGEFKYGSPMPTPGSQAYRDMNEYFAYGGQDPYNIYGRGLPDQALANEERLRTQQSGGV